MRWVSLMLCWGLAYVFSGVYAQLHSPRHLRIRDIDVITHPIATDVASLVIGHRGGRVALIPPDKAGMGALVAATVVESGTRKRRGAQFADFLKRENVEITYDADYEYIAFMIRYEQSYQPVVGDISRELFLRQTFDSMAFEKARGKILDFWREVEKDPIKWLLYQVNRSIFRNTPYAQHPYGSAETIRKISFSEVKRYYFSLLRRMPGELALGRVGGGNEALFLRFLRENLPAVRSAPPEKKGCAKEHLPDVLRSGKRLTIYQRPNSEMAYVAMSLGGFRYDVSDLPAILIALIILEDRMLFNEAPTSGIADFQAHIDYTGKVYPLHMVLVVSDPYQFVRSFVPYLKRFYRQGVTMSEVSSVKNLYVTYKGWKKWASMEAARQYVHGQLAMGDWEYEEKFLRRLLSVTPEDVNQAIRKYFKDIEWYYMGDPALLDTAVFYRPWE